MLNLLVADGNGAYFELPGMGAAGRSGDRFVELILDDLIKLPAGASLVLIPEGVPLAVDDQGEFKHIADDPWNGQKVYAVGALLPQGYTRTFLPACLRPENSNPLPLMGYTAVALVDGEIYAAAEKTEDPGRWDPIHYDTPQLKGLVRKTVAAFPQNRVLAHLAHCALEYSCFTAQNIFYRRWEGGIPVSPSCNAGCLGCISQQEAGCCPAQERIRFQPGVDEVVEIATRHLAAGEGAIISFGQGCEGEPSLAADVIAPAIKKVRAQTEAGTFNMNTNGGDTSKVLKICSAGLNSMRVSLISARQKTYRAYYRPRGYDLPNVMDTIREATEMGVFVAINLLVFPGLTDCENEVEALLDFLPNSGVRQVQMRNLNIDPDLLWGALGDNRRLGEPLGIPRLVELLKSEVPGLIVGSYSKPVKSGH